MILYKIKEPVFEKETSGGHPFKVLQTPSGEVRVYHDAAMGRRDDMWNLLIEGDGLQVMSSHEKFKQEDAAVAAAVVEYHKQIQRWLDEVVIK